MSRFILNAAAPGAWGVAVAGEAFASYRAKRRIPNLDGLRGLAVLLVLAHHVPDIAVAWLAQLQHNARHGVSLFFVISGYIVVTLLLREHRASGRVDVGGFLTRRALRLMPLYYLVLLGEGVLAFFANAYSPENQALFADKLTCYVLYCSNWLTTSGEGPFFVAWSLAVEEQFYLFLSCLLVFCPLRHLAGVVGGLLLLKVLALLLWGEANLAAMPWRVLVGYSEAILLGVLLAIGLDHPTGFRVIYRMTCLRGACTALLVTVAALLLVGDLSHKSGAQALLFYVVCTALVGLCVTRNPLPVLGRGVVPLIGLVSYGVYLMHMPVLSVIKRFTGDPLLILTATLALVMPLAWLSLRCFEEPLRGLARRGTAAPPTPENRRLTGAVGAPVAPGIEPRNQSHANHRTGMHP